jgi:hypothetical protein
MNQEKAATLGYWRFVTDQIVLKLSHPFVVPHPLIPLSAVQGHQLKQRLPFFCSFINCAVKRGQRLFYWLFLHHCLTWGA